MQIEIISHKSFNQKYALAVRERSANLHLQLQMNKSSRMEIHITRGGLCSGNIYVEGGFQVRGGLGIGG